MNTVVTTIQIAAGVYFLLGALMLNTSNARSSFLFKVVPFFLGCALLIVAAYQNGLVGAPGPAKAKVDLEGAAVAEYVCIEPEAHWGAPEHCWRKEVTIEFKSEAVGSLDQLSKKRPPRVPCTGRRRMPDLDQPGIKCGLARNEIAVFRPLIGVIGAETLFETSETPIWNVNRRFV